MKTKKVKRKGNRKTVTKVKYKKARKSHGGHKHHGTHRDLV